MLRLHLPSCRLPNVAQQWHSVSAGKDAVSLFGPLPSYLLPDLPCLSPMLVAFPLASNLSFGCPVLCPSLPACSPSLVALSLGMSDCLDLLGNSLANVTQPQTGLHYYVAPHCSWLGKACVSNVRPWNFSPHDWHSTRFSIWVTSWRVWDTWAVELWFVSIAKKN